MEKIMNIVYSSSNAYCECTCISLISLLENNKSCDISIYVLSTDISDENKVYLRNIAQQYNRSITIIDAKDDFINGSKIFKLELLRGAYNTYSRIMLNNWFSDLEKVIVVDSDTLIVNDISEMDKINLDGKLIAAVPEIAVYSANSTIEDKELLSSIDTYFNMGIVVVNLKEWRKRDINSYLIKKIEEEKKVNKVADQSIINRYLNKYIVRMNLRYNYYSPMHGTSYKMIKRVFNVKEVFKENEIAEAQKKPAIIHFYGHSFERPWFKHSATPYKKEYKSYRNKTKWSRVPAQKWRKPSNFVLKVYDLLCFFLLKLHMYDTCLYFRYVIGQRTKGKTGIKR